MNRLQFLATSILSSLATLIPWKRRRNSRDKILACFDGMPPYSADELRSSKPFFMTIRKTIHQQSGEVEPFGYIETRYTLMNSHGKWQWRTDTGLEMSPLFDTEEEALAFKA